MPFVCDLGPGGAGGMGGVGGQGGMGGSGGFLGSACINPSDLDVIDMSTSTMPVSNLRQIAAQCAQVDCSGVQPDTFVNCVAMCVQNSATPNGQLSIPCSCCYGRFARCAGMLCNQACIGDPCVPLCLDNQDCVGGDYSNCLDELDDCAGRNSLDCSEP